MLHLGSYDEDHSHEGACSSRGPLSQSSVRLGGYRSNPGSGLTMPRSAPALAAFPSPPLLVILDRTQVDPVPIST